MVKLKGVLQKKTGLSQSSVSRILKNISNNISRERYFDPKIIDRLCLDLFNSIVEDSPWVRFLEHLRVVTKSDFVTISIFSDGNTRPNVILAKGVKDVLVDDGRYLEGRYYTKELLVGIPEGVVKNLSDVIEFEELEKTDFYKQYLGPLNIHFVMGVDIGNIQDVSASLRLSRMRGGGDYGVQERKIISELIPFIHTAMRIFIKTSYTEVGKDALAATISGMSVGSLLLTAEGSILDANQPALEILEQCDGILCQDGKLKVFDKNISKILRSLIKKS